MSFKNEVRNSVVAQMLAHGYASLAPTNHERVYFFN
jgi:hypothetical protein